LLNGATMRDFLYRGRGGNCGACDRQHECCDNNYVGTPDVRPIIGHGILQNGLLRLTHPS
jgi:hypothetical protein